MFPYRNRIAKVRKCAPLEIEKRMGYTMLQFNAWFDQFVKYVTDQDYLHKYLFN